MAIPPTVWTDAALTGGDWDNNDPTGAFQGDAFEEEAFDIRPQQFVWVQSPVPAPDWN